MRVNLNYEAVSLVFAVLIFLNHFFSYTDNSVLNRTFRKLAVLNILSITANIASLLDIAFYERVHFLGTLFTAAYFALYGWMAFTFSIYIDNLLQECGKRNSLLRPRKILILIFTVAVVVNLVTGTFYTIEDHCWVKTPLFPMLLVTPFAMLLYTAAVTAFYMRKLPLRQTLPAFAVLAIVLTGVKLQATVFQNVKIAGTATTLSLLVVLFTLEAPERQKILEVLEVYHQDLEKNVREKTAEISIVQNGIINGLVDLLNRRGPAESGHVRRCTHIVQLITDRMRQEDLSPNKQKFFDNVVKAAPLHDIGDETPVEELFNPESNMIRRILGECSDDDFIQVTENIVRYHNTRYDGSGALDNNTGEFIPLEARIMTIAESFDDYMSQESEEPVTVPVAMNRIWDAAGTVIDPTLIKYIFACRDDLTAYYQEAGHAF